MPPFNATGEEGRGKAGQVAWQSAGAKSQHGCSGIGFLFLRVFLIMMQEVLPQLHEIMTSTEFLVGNHVRNTTADAESGVYLYHTAPHTLPSRIILWLLSNKIQASQQAGIVGFCWFFFFVRRGKSF